MLMAEKRMGTGSGSGGRVHALSNVSKRGACEGSLCEGARCRREQSQSAEDGVIHIIVDFLCEDIFCITVYVDEYLVRTELHRVTG